MGSRRKYFRLRRTLRRLAADQHVLLAIAIVLAALVVEVASQSRPGLVAVPSIAFLGVQIVAGLPWRGARPSGLDTARLILALGAVMWMSIGSGDPSTLPLASLLLPIIAMAAAIGTPHVAVVGGVCVAIALIMYTIPGLATPTIQTGLIQRGVALGATAVVLAIGTRRTVAMLERAIIHSQASRSGMRRRSRQMAAVEEAGRLLAADGPTDASMDAVMGLLVDRFGYRYVSIYIRDGDLMRLRAQRGYDEVIETFDGTVGVVGRVMRTGETALVPDVSHDTEYRAASQDVRSEVSVPLRAADTVIGVLNVESGQDARPLDEGDRDTLVLIGDRIAGALALAREREALRERAELFTRLAAFGSAINASLDPDTAHTAIVTSVATALETDIVALILRDPSTGDDRIVALNGGDGRYVGVRIPPGEGVVSRAMAERRVLSEAALPRSGFPTTVQGAREVDVLAAAGVPLIHEGEIIGGLSVCRLDLARPYTPLELEALPLIASQVSLALANVALHTKVADAAIRDSLTGLWNRRHLEVACARLFAARARFDPDERHPVAAILFDLDHFGSFNKRYGHSVGDAVLRTFGSILTRRLRSSDIVARYGGEEFVAILDGASVDEAQRVADEIRRELEAARVTGSGGEELRATVSAGCASLGPAVASLEALLEIADVALQMAKRGGRNQVVAA
ncbi:MAG TPA: sensor domain-containing diguanylate cyclase [Candidatus Limnocylindrales bacterium]|jgi:diguanylate cyclase (GGDEF)-like protein|nr:sensor domain-containing diguanylate cyclase [Candidatus Limnocylindrales bacterium]